MVAYLEVYTQLMASSLVCFTIMKLQKFISLHYDKGFFLNPPVNTSSNV